MKTPQSYYVVPEGDINQTMINLVGEDRVDESIVHIRVSSSRDPIRAWELDERQFKSLCCNRDRIPFKAYVRRGNRHVEISIDDLHKQSQEDRDLLDTAKNTQHALSRVLGRRAKANENHTGARKHGRLATRWAAGDGRL